PRRLGDRGIRGNGLVEDTHALELGRSRFAPDRLPVATLVGALHELLDERRIGEAASLLLERQRAQLPPDRQAVERQLRAERGHRADAAAVGEAEHAAPA